jgi:hypothetical protein
MGTVAATRELGALFLDQCMIGAIDTRILYVGPLVHWSLGPLVPWSRRRGFNCAPMYVCPVLYVRRAEFSSILFPPMSPMSPMAACVSGHPVSSG